jgi:hypothetical protein
LHVHDVRVFERVAHLQHEGPACLVAQQKLLVALGVYAFGAYRESPALFHESLNDS